MFATADNQLSLLPFYQVYNVKYSVSLHLEQLLQFHSKNPYI
jgi:hypothetical protein